ncbi:MAG: hypothetical protein AB1626_01590 [Candidatus Micrarchaeota archaeon]
MQELYRTLREKVAAHYREGEGGKLDPHVLVIELRERISPIEFGMAARAHGLRIEKGTVRPTLRAVLPNAEFGVYTDPYGHDTPTLAVLHEGKSARLTAEERQKIMSFLDYFKHKMQLVH